MNSYQQTGKSISVRARAHMPLGFFETHDTAEHVFHSEGQKHLRVRFELGQIDNDIRLCGVPGNFNLAVRLADIQHHRIFKRRANNIKPLQRYVDFVHFYDAFKRADGGRIGNLRTRAFFQNVFHGGFNDQRVRQNGVLRRRERKQIGFYQNALAAFDFISGKFFHDLEKSRF